ncbi:hypothetical protein AB0J65_17445 [Streptomyces toxytricini]
MTRARTAKLLALLDGNLGDLVVGLTAEVGASLTSGATICEIKD